MVQPMNYRFSALAVVLLLVLAPSVWAHGDMRFRRLSIEDGLSQSTVEAIAQDQQGFMWFGTEDGLNRFDGYQFTKFKHDPDIPGSISGNNIWCLHVDRQGYLWIGTFSSGLNRYDPETGSFTRFAHDPSDSLSISSNRIRSIAEDAQGDLWVGTRDGGLNRLPAGSRAFLRMRHDPNNRNGLLSDNVRFALPDSGSTVWIATNRGFSRFAVDSGEFTHFQAGPEGSNTIRSNNVRHLLRDRSGMLWVSTAGGLVQYDPSTNHFVNHRNDPAEPASISGDSIRKSYEDRQGHLWISTSHGGLNLLDRQTNTFTSFRPDRNDQHSLSANSTRVSFQDDGGILWVGTIGGGLNMYDPRTDRYRHFRYDPDDMDSLSDPILWAVAEGPKADLWFGTSQGLDHYDRQTGKVERHLSGQDEDVTAKNYTRCLTWDNSGRLWIGRLYTGIDIYDPDSHEFTNLRHSPTAANTISSNNVRAVYQDMLGDMWFGTWGGGLDNFGPRTGTFTNFGHLPDDPASLSHNNVVSMLQDSDGTYWVATARGLNRLVFDGDPTVPISVGGRRSEITRYHHDPDDPRSISNNYVLSIHEARNGDLWFGTMLGLSRLRRSDRGHPVFDRYFMKDGLPSDVVYGILEDDHGKLWLSTNYGLSRFDPDTETFRNYDTRDGLLVNEYNTGAYARTSAGTFIFGGVGGASEFTPESIVDNSYAPPVVLTGFNVFDKPAQLGKSLSDLDEITLSYRDNFFSFEFAALDFSTPDRNRYSYMLEGLDKTWTQAGTRNYVGYTHVDAGAYTFMVRGTNSDGVWSDRTASMRIVITPPFWKTWWFVLLLVVAVGSGVALLIIIRVRQLLAIERLRSKIAADLHDDIGAGLTEIAMMGHVITQKLPSASRHLVQGETQKIRTTARSLIACMSDIVWLVDPGRDSLYDLISRLGDSFSETLNALGIRFTAENLASLKSVRLKMEHRQHLLLIFKEAINNSLKYSGCTEIHLKVNLTGNRLIIRVNDNGSGFDAQAHPSGNGLKNMRNRAQRIGGAVTIGSTAGEGTIVEYTGSIK
jgi:ligand-binding sensor domain-containing protein